MRIPEDTFHSMHTSRFEFIILRNLKLGTHWKLFSIFFVLLTLTCLRCFDTGIRKSIQYPEQNSNLFFLKFIAKWNVKHYRILIDWRHHNPVNFGAATCVLDQSGQLHYGSFKKLVGPLSIRPISYRRCVMDCLNCNKDDKSKKG